MTLNAKISALYLSIVNNPATSMGIQWHTTLDQEETAIAFKLPNGSWETKMGEYIVTESEMIHKVILENLTPKTEYAFRIGNYPRVYLFSTASNDPNEPFQFVISLPPNPFPSTGPEVAKHIKDRSTDLFAKKDFFFFPIYPPTTHPINLEGLPYPFKNEDPIRDSCEKTRAAFQRIYSPDLCPDPLSLQALTAASGDQANQLFHNDQGTDYGGMQGQDAFDSFHQKTVSLVAQVLKSFTDPKDFSLYATLHAIGLLKLKMAVDTETSDPLQLGRWRAKAVSFSSYEDDPDKYFIVLGLTPIPANTRYRRYHKLMQSMLSPGSTSLRVKENLEGSEIQLSTLWDDGIEHTPATYTVQIIDFLEKKVQKILGQKQTPAKTVFLRDLALVHWWLAQLMPFFRGSASCAEILIQAIAVAKGISPPRLAGLPWDDKENGFLFADLEAIYTPLEQFIFQYPFMLERLSVLESVP